MTGKCKPGKVSRTVSTSRLTLDLTVMCTSGVKVPTPGASTQVVLPPATMAGTVTAVGTNTLFVATSAPVVEQPGMHAREFPTLRLSESPELLPSFGLSSSSPSPTLPWGAAEDSSPPFSPNRVQAGHSQDVPDEGSLFNVSPLSPGLFFRPPRGSKSPPTGGVLLPTTLDDFDDSVLGDPITYARCEKFPGSESPLSLLVYAWLSGSAFLLDPTVLQYFRLCWLRGPPHCRRRGPRPLPLQWTRGGQVIRDGTAGLSVPILGVRRTAVYRWQPGIWIAASSCSVSGACGSSGVSPTPRLFTNFLGGSVGQGTSDGSGYQPTARRRCYVAKSADTVTFCYGDEQNVVLHDGLRPRTVVVPRIEVNDMSPAPRAAWAASYMSAMGLWRPQTGPGAPGPVPVSSCRSCMSCKYCFPEDQLPPG